MSAMNAPIDVALFGKLKAGDERAFEQLFRERYAEMVGDATSRLDGDGASAARGVANVFTQVWKNREQFATPQDLQTFLGDAVGEAAARIKSQHAVAHELSEHEGVHAKRPTPKAVPAVDEAWSKLRQSLNANTAQTAARDRASHSRHGAAEHMASLAKPKPRGPMIVAGVAILVIFVAAGLWLSGKREESELNSGLASTDARPFQTGLGEVSKVTLNDKSTATLGPETKMLVPKGFGSTVRGVKLDGTATFVVSSGQKKQFIVRAGNATLTAEGTEFSVRAYPNEGDVTVRVVDGEVKATVGDSVHPIAKGSSLVVTADGAMHVASASEMEQALGWVDGTVVATDRPLREVLVLAKRWFALNLLVRDSTLYARKVSMRAGVGLTKDAIASIESSGDLKRVWEGDNMVLHDNAAGAKKPGARPR